MSAPAAPRISEVPPTRTSLPTRCRGPATVRVSWTGWTVRSLVAFAPVLSVTVNVTTLGVVATGPEGGAVGVAVGLTGRGSAPGAFGGGRWVMAPAGPLVSVQA